ncbi:MAG: hypothetical protein RSD67_02900 [Oscillospiraceae bacterium]
MNFENVPKHIKISQSIIFLMLYVIVCVLASNSFVAINIISAIYFIITLLIAYVHYIFDEKYISISNICLSILVYILLVILH